MAKKSTQKDLWGNPLQNNMEAVDDRPVLLFNDISTTKNFASTFHKLDTRYTMDNLSTKIEHIKRTFNKFRIRDKKNPQSPIPVWEDLFNKKHFKKDYLCALALILADDENFTTYFDKIPADVQKLWEYIYTHVYGCNEGAEAATGRKWLQVSSTYSYWSSRTTMVFNDNACCFFETHSYYNYWFKNSGAWMTMNNDMWELYGRAIFRPRHKELIENAGYEEKQLLNLPKLHRYNNEDSIGEQITLLQQLHRQGALPLGVNKMSQATIKKAAAQIRLAEFFPDTKDKNLSLMAASLMIPALVAQLNYEDKTIIKYWEALYDGFDSFSYEMIAMEFLTHLKSVRREYIIYESYIESIFTGIGEILQNIKPGLWYTFDDIETLRIFNCDNQDKVTMVYDSFIYNGKATFESNGERIHVEDAYRAFARPVAQGFLFLLAACGLLEIAYHDPRKGELTRFDCIEYIKLTPLGEFVYDHTKTYVAKDVHSPLEHFEADTERLLIRSILIDGNNPYEGMLNGIAEPIGSHRYRVTPATFMKGCTGVTDVNAKKQLFIDNICANPTKVWTDFFHKMVMHCHPLSNAGVGYRVMKFLPSDHELQQILASDKFIREHTLKAEKYHILIEVKSYDKVIERLRTYGYIM